MDFLLRLEQSGFATWVREGGTIWSYPFILFMHTLGLATLAGVNGGIDLRILGRPTAAARSVEAVLPPLVGGICRDRRIGHRAPHR